MASASPCAKVKPGAGRFTVSPAEIDGLLREVHPDYGARPQIAHDVLGAPASAAADLQHIALRQIDAPDDMMIKLDAEAAKYP